MACCGQKRSQITTQAMQATQVRRHTSPVRQPSVRPQVVARQAVSFQYVGASVLTTTGAISGRFYRFGQPGAVLEVDSRDASSLATIPNLRKL